MAEHGAHSVPPAPTPAGHAKMPHEAPNEDDDYSLAGDIVGPQHVMSDVVFVLFGMLLIGIITRHVFSRIPIPYTVLLLIWGLIAGGLGVLAHEKEGGWHAVNTGLSTMAAIDPNGLLLVFMPTLIYGSAQAMDWHTLRKEFVQILLLAGTGVIVCMILTAVFIYYIFPFGWTWHQCFMFGALISATDPVAVVALLSEVGASKRLGTIIEGESLLNDGTAFVLFLIFKEYVLFNSCCEGPGVVPTNLNSTGCILYVQTDVCEPFSPGDAAILFLQLALGGPASGLMFGLLMVLWLTYALNDEIVEIFITIVGAYVTFYISEDVFGVSSILAVVTLGFFMAGFGRSKISPRVLHPMETAWHLLEWSANTVIFVLAGVIMAENLAPSSSTNREGEADREGRVIGVWIGYGVLLFVACVVIRFVTVLLHYPILTKIGYGLTWQEAIIISWSGLRGAIGLAIALLINLDTSLDPDFRYQVLLFTSIVVVLSLLINGSLTRLLLEKLGVLAPQPIKVELLLHTIEEMDIFADKHCSHLKEDRLIGAPDWAKVVEQSHIDASQLVDKQSLAHMKRQPAVIDSPSDPIQVDLVVGSGMSKPHSNEMRLTVMNARNAKQAALIKDIRSRLLHGLKETYHQGFHKGYIGPSELLELQSSVDTSMDALDEAVRDWDLIEPHARISKATIMMQGRLGRMPGPIKALAQQFLFNELEHGIIMAAAFVYAHKKVRSQMKQTTKDAARDQTLDPQVFSLTHQAVQVVLGESKESTSKAVQFIKALKYAYPEVTRAVKTKLCTMTVLLKKSKFLENLAESGLIELTDYDSVQKAIIMKMNLLGFRGWRQAALPEPAELMRAIPLFSSLTDEEYTRDVLPIAKHVLLQADQVLFRRGDNATSLYLVVRGTTKSDDFGNGNGSALMDHKGSAIGISEIMMGLPRARTVKALSLVEGFEIRGEVFAQLIVKYPEMEKMAWRNTGATIAMLNQDKCVEDMAREDVHEWFLNSEVSICNRGEDYHVVGYTYVVQGSLTKVLGLRSISQNPGVIAAPVMLGPNFAHFRVESGFAVFLQLPDKDSIVHSGLESLKRESFKSSIIRKSMGSDLSPRAQGPLNRLSAAVVNRAAAGTRTGHTSNHESSQVSDNEDSDSDDESPNSRKLHGTDVIMRLSLGETARNSMVPKSPSAEPAGNTLGALAMSPSTEPAFGTVSNVTFEDHDHENLNHSV